VKKFVVRISALLVVAAVVQLSRTWSETLQKTNSSELLFTVLTD